MPIDGGSFGTIFKAMLRNRQQVAVKESIRADPSRGAMTYEQLATFQRELDAYGRTRTSATSHPNIVSYVGCVIQHDRLAIVLEYIEGERV